MARLAETKAESGSSDRCIRLTGLTLRICVHDAHEQRIHTERSNLSYSHAVHVQEPLAKIVAALGLKVDARAAAHPDARTALKAVLRAWLPLSDAVLGMAVQHLPCPTVHYPFTHP